VTEHVVEDQPEVRDTIRILIVYIALFALVWVIVFRELISRGVISGAG